MDSLELTKKHDCSKSSIAAMFETRAQADDSDWQSGEQLAENAQKYFENNGKKIMEVVNDYENMG